jgi:hypothetical protein
MSQQYKWSFGRRLERVKNERLTPSGCYPYQYSILGFVIIKIRHGSRELEKQSATLQSEKCLVIESICWNLLWAMCSISSRHKCASFSRATAALGGCWRSGHSLDTVRWRGRRGEGPRQGVWTCEVDPRVIAASKEAFAKYDTEGKIHLIEGPSLQTCVGRSI